MPRVTIWVWLLVVNRTGADRIGSDHGYAAGTRAPNRVPARAYMVANKPQSSFAAIRVYG
jgi:hypothetical protein